jgi:hypothetical protein
LAPYKSLTPLSSLVALPISAHSRPWTVAWSLPDFASRGVKFSLARRSIPLYPFPAFVDIDTLSPLCIAVCILGVQGDESTILSSCTRGLEFAPRRRFFSGVFEGITKGESPGSHVGGSRQSVGAARRPTVWLGWRPVLISVARGLCAESAASAGADVPAPSGNPRQGPSRLSRLSPGGRALPSADCLRAEMNLGGGEVRALVPAAGPC